MATKICRICGAEKDESMFYPEGRQCRRCLADRSTQRYRTKYRAILAERRTLADRGRKTPAVSRLSVAELAYTAGLVDGEGCVHLCKHGKAGGTSARIGQVTLHVTVRNTSEPMIRFLQTRWGGSVSAFAEKPDLNRKAQWAWVLTANNALTFLDDIYEYLIVKHRQAQLARRFQRYVQRTGRARTPRVAILQDKFFLEMRRLNWRGLNPPAR